MGANDYYNYNRSSYRRPLGGIDMMDENIGSHNVWTKMAYGWLDPIYVNGNAKVKLRSAQEYGDAILLKDGWNGSSFDEMIMIELSTPTGLNEFDTNYRYGNYVQGPNTRGIRLWHVDARLTSYRGSYTFSGLLTNPNDKTGYGVVTAMTNTYDGNGVSSGYLSPLGSEYYNFNLLQLIHNDKTIDNSASKRNLSAESLFKTNDTFDMSSYGDQFYRNGKLNSNSDLGFTFTVNGFTDEFASITVTKI